MNTRLKTILAAVLALTVAAAWGYDHELAASYEALFQPVAGAKAGKALHLVTAEALVEELKQGKELVALDVRTPAEAGVFTMALPGSLAIPINELFTAENLERIPTGKPVVVICLSGTRATAAGTALRHVGFDNVRILKGGFKALVGYLNPKTANVAPKVAGVPAR